MKNIAIVTLIGLVSACTTSQNVYQRRAEASQKYQENAIDQSLKSQPKWMSKPPANNSSVIFAAAEGTADSYNMAVHLARTNALSDLCYNSQGKVTSQTKQFETESSKTSSIEKVTRTNCDSADVTGVEIYSTDIGENPVVVRTGTRYTAYVLLALPIGDANTQRATNDRNNINTKMMDRSNTAFKEIEGR